MIVEFYGRKPATADLVVLYRTDTNSINTLPRYADFVVIPNIKGKYVVLEVTHYLAEDKIRVYVQYR